ncbi:polysaccharide pyruvyl transferase family protein [Variovorax sp. GB1R11]|uniref:polysaccharide pyruvyl transferase family protein n=1 Tax=Variovorax sp. GB1R11 TaxID=3443741 RepID=UPI003F475AE1
MIKNFLLIDAFSTLHVGNGALIENTYNLVRENGGESINILSIDPQTNIGHFPNVYEDIFKKYNGGAFQKLSFALSLGWFFCVELINTIAFRSKLRLPWGEGKRKLLDLIDESDVCISLSGETINDHYFPHMYQRVLIYWLAILKKKDFIIFPQSIGPIFRPISRYLLRLTLGNSRFIIARDKQSLEVATLLWEGKPAKIFFCPDVAVMQDSNQIQSELKKASKKLLGVTVSDAPKAEMGITGDYLQELYRAIGLTFPAEEYEILMMPSNYSHSGVSKDYQACQIAMEIFIENGYSARILENRLHYPQEFQGIQKSLFAFISTRMHVGILATSAGIPTFMINTQHKILSYMENIEMQSYVSGIDEPENVLIEKLEKIRDLNEQIRLKLIAANQKMRAEVTAKMAYIFQKISE